MAAAVAGSAMAQGTVTFIASGTSRPVTYSTDGTTYTKFAVAASAQAGSFGTLNIGMYAAASGTTISLLPSGAPDLSSWLLCGPVLHAINFTPGNITGTTETTPASLGAPGATEQIIVVGWTGNFADFGSAVASGTSLVGWTGSAASGGALGWTQVTGTSSSPQVQTLGATGFNGLALGPIVATPEPGTLVLGGLGAASLLLFRRRK